MTPEQIQIEKKNVEASLAALIDEATRDDERMQRTREIALREAISYFDNDLAQSRDPFMINEGVSIAKRWARLGCVPEMFVSQEDYKQFTDELIQNLQNELNEITPPNPSEPRPSM